MRPPANRYPAPLGQQCRVVIISLGNFPHLVGEFQSLDEILEFLRPFQAGNIFLLNDLPIGQQIRQFFDLQVGKRGIAASTGNAF